MRLVRYHHNHRRWGSAGVMFVHGERHHRVITFHVDRDRYRGWTFTVWFFTLRIKIDIDTPRARRMRAG